jgi:hypothetical protein
LCSRARGSPIARLATRSHGATAIPEAPEKIITVDRRRRIDALPRAQLTSSETRGVEVAATREGATITSDHPDLGEEREAEYSSDPMDRARH